MRSLRHLYFLHNLFLFICCVSLIPKLKLQDLIYLQGQKVII